MADEPVYLYLAVYGTEKEAREDFELVKELHRKHTLGTFDAAALEHALKTMAEERGAGIGDLIHPVRVAVSGSGVGPGLFVMLEVLGRERVLRRIDAALARFA